MGEWGISTPVDFISFGLNPIYFLEWWNVYIKQGEEREGCSPLSCSTMNNQHREIGVCQVRSTGPASTQLLVLKTLVLWDLRFSQRGSWKTKLLGVVLPRRLENSDWRPKGLFCFQFQVQVVQEASSLNHSNILNVMNFLRSSGRIG